MPMKFVKFAYGYSSILMRCSVDTGRASIKERKIPVL